MTQRQTACIPAGDSRAIRRIHPLHNERGSVIFAVLLVLVLITLAAVMMSRTTRTELDIATSDQLHTISFYAAEAAQTYVMLNNNLYGSSNIDTSNPMNFPNDADPTAVQSLVSGSNQAFNGEVAYQTSMLTPRGSGFEAGKFKAHVYALVCNGYGPRDSNTQIEIGFYRVGF